MNQSDLPMYPTPGLHEFVADTLADEAHHEIKRMAKRARIEIEARFRQIEVTYHRSIAQRRRFWRIRTTQEKA